MSIFEALKIGMGKATLPGYIDYVSYTDKDGISWSCRPPIISTVRYSEIKRDDWIPYVPPEEKKIEGLVNFVPRGTCSNCGQAMPSPKTQHKEVFENVKWGAYPCTTRSNCLTVSTSFDITKGGTKGMSFANKPPMKMTLEWEE